MWVLVITVLWYHAPSVTEIYGFTSQDLCEVAGAKVSRKFTSDGWSGTGATEYGQAICVRQQ